MLSTHEGLAKLANEDREAATAIELRAFAALTNEEAAAAMGLSVATFRRAHQLGMAFLKEVMRNSTV
ncbi:MAG: ECF-type sigma factor [Ignavibacteriota bacterium]